MCYETSATALVTRAQAGDQQAWDILVERYAPLVWSICRRYRLGRADAYDVGQHVWLQLAHQLDRSGDPAARPGWLAITTSPECAKALRAAQWPAAAAQMPEDTANSGTMAAAAEEELLLAERRAALREAFAHLPTACQRLLALLIEDPPVPYAKIGAELGIPVGSIGPSRGRCLDKLRGYPAVAALMVPNQASAGTGPPGHNSGARANIGVLLATPPSMSTC